MKLRIHGNSLRLRLNRCDVEQIRTSGVCVESLRFSSNSKLTYTLKTSSQLAVMEVCYLQDCIRVLLPLDMLRNGSAPTGFHFRSTQRAAPLW